MNQTQRKLFLIFFLVLAVSVGSITGILSYLIYQGQLARFGDIFDRVGFQQAQAWGVPALIAIVGITLAIVFVIIGLWKFREDDTGNRVKKSD